MITTKSLQELWQEHVPAILCYPTMLLPATIAADALTWKTGVVVVVKPSPEFPANGSLAVFDPYRVLSPVIDRVPAIIQEYQAAHGEPHIRLDTPEDDEG